jgi:eukaryotic-like serine/threonine-protein kinase
VNAERWQKIETIYHAALTRPAEQRNAYVIEACAGDNELCTEVQMLIARHEESGSFIDTPVFDLGVRALAEQAALSAGKTVGHYVILDIIGRGGMGEVYLARDPRLGRKVALKLLPVELKSDRDRVQRFRQEARAASAVSHPNIAHVYDVGEADGRFYTAIEYVDGVSLRQLIVEGKIDTQHALDIAIQVAEALAAAHAAGVVHRDIKPENVMVRHDGYVKVLDFGLAKLTEQQKPTVSGEADTVQMVQTQAGVLMGTATYMSPEQARGLEVDARTDIWSLGVVLYEMIAARAPFDGDSISDVIAAILRTEPPQLNGLSLEQPDELQRIVNKSLRKNREERYQTTKDLILDLTNLKRELELSAELHYLARPLEQASQSDGKTKEESNHKLRQTESTHVIRPTSSAEYILTEIKQHKKGAIILLATIAVAVTGIGFGIYKFTRQKQSAAVQESKPRRLSRLTFDPGLQISPTWSPDGRLIAYASDRSGNFDIWVEAVSGGNAVQVSHSAANDWQPDWSPDGANLVFRSERDGGGLFVVPVLGGLERRISSFGYNPKWSPDGSKILFSSIGSGMHAGEAYIVDLVGGAPREILSDFLKELKLTASITPRLVWYPDSKHVSVIGQHSKLDWGYWTVPIDGGSPINALDVSTELQKELDSIAWERIDNLIWACRYQKLRSAGGSVRNV